MRDDAVGLRDVIVRVAQSGRHDAHQHLEITWCIEIGVDHLPLAGLLHEDGGSGLHFSALPGIRSTTSV